MTGKLLGGRLNYGVIRLVSRSEGGLRPSGSDGRVRVRLHPAALDLKGRRHATTDLVSAWVARREGPEPAAELDVVAERKPVGTELVRPEFAERREGAA